MSADGNISDVVFTEANVLKAARRTKTKSQFAGDDLPIIDLNYDCFLWHRLLHLKFKFRITLKTTLMQCTTSDR